MVIRLGNWLSRKEYGTRDITKSKRVQIKFTKHTGYS